MMYLFLLDTNIVYIFFRKKIYFCKKPNNSLYLNNSKRQLGCILSTILDIFYTFVTTKYVAICIIM